MTLIRKRLIKEYVFTRKKQSQSITLESLMKLLGEDCSVDTLTELWISYVDLSMLKRIMLYSNKMSNKIVLSHQNLENHLRTLVQNAIKNFISSNEVGIYIGEYIVIHLAVNKQNKHIINIYPNIEV